MNKIAFLFPGQGAQYPNMGKDFYDNFSFVREFFEEASDILKRDLAKLIFEESEEVLKKTVNSQIAIFITSIAILKVIEAQLNLKPFASCGLSLGEYSALFASKRISLKDVLVLIQKRAEFMDQSCEKNQGAMSAILGLDSNIIEQILSDITSVWVANYNTIEQTVISGTLDGIKTACQKLNDAGAKRIVPLVVSGAFHCALMMDAQEKLEEFIQNVQFLDSNIGLIMNVTGDFVSSVSEVRANLISQVTKSVKWRQGIERLEKEGIDLYLEIGPSKTLTMMNKKNKVKNQSLNVEKISDLEKLSIELI